MNPMDGKNDKNSETEPTLEAALEQPLEAVGVAARGTSRATEIGPRGYKAGGRKAMTDVADVAPVKVSAYVRPEQLRALRLEVVRRQNKGLRADLSALIREALDAFLAK